MINRPLTQLRPMSDNLNCSKNLLNSTGLNVEADFALFKGNICEQSFSHNIRQVIGHKNLGFKNYRVNSIHFIPFTISISGLATAEYLDEGECYGSYLIQAPYQILIRGIFTLDKHKLPTHFKGHASCILLTNEWFTRGGDSIGHGKPNISGGTYFEDEATINAPPLFMEVEKLGESTIDENLG